MTHEELVLEAIRYRRYFGADLRSIRSYLQFREDEPHSRAEDRQALERLEESGQVVRAGTRWLLAPAVHDRARGPVLKPEFQASDVWILAALLGCHRHGGPAALVELIAMADGINKAIPTFDELYGALNRLASGGLIRFRKGHFEVTPRALALQEKADAVRPRSSLWHDLERILLCPCCGVRLKAVRWRIPLTEADLQRAQAEYTERFERGRRGRQSPAKGDSLPEHA